MKFKSLAQVILLWSSLYQKLVKKRKVCTVFYSSETGTAKRLAKQAVELFSMTYMTKLLALNEAPDKLREKIGGKSDIELTIASTFGNGEAPKMSREYTAALNELVDMYGTKKNGVVLNGIFKTLHFGVFGLGSSAYPKFAAYGQHLDKCFESLGASRMIPYATGDALKDQKGSFNKWLKNAFLASHKIMNIDTPKSFLENINAVKKYRWKLATKNKSKSLKTALSEFHEVPVSNFYMTHRTNLHTESSEPATLKLDFKYEKHENDGYQPGDHLSVFPANDKMKVDFLKTFLNDNPPEDRHVTLQVETQLGWEALEDFPNNVTFDDMLTYFLDITQVPSQALLEILAKFTEDKEERGRLTILANDDIMYEKWSLDLKV